MEVSAVFNEALRERGYLSDSEFDILQSLYRSVDKVLEHVPDVIVYLHCDIDLILKRIDRRGREGEEEIDEEYLRTLNRLYDDWIRDLDRCPVVEFDSSEFDFFKQRDRNLVLQRIEELREFNDPIV